MRRAEWRRRADDPRGIRRVRVWAGELLALRRVRHALAIIATGPAFVAIFVVLMTNPALMLGSFGLAGTFCLIPLLFPERFDRLLDAQRVRRERGLEGLLPVPAPKDTFLVNVALRYRGVPTGFDVAAGSFTEGWLCLDGRRTSFALHAAYGRASWREGTLRIDLEDGQSVSVSLADGQEGAGAYFRHAATLWAAERDRPFGESILPPLTTHPVTRVGWGFVLCVSGLMMAAAPLLNGLSTGALSQIAATTLMGIGAITFVRAAFVVHAQNEADERARALPTRSAPASSGHSDSGLQSSESVPSLKTTL